MVASGDDVRFNRENASVYQPSQSVDILLRLMNGSLVLRVATHISGDYTDCRKSCVRRSVYVRYAGVSANSSIHHAIWQCSRYVSRVSARDNRLRSASMARRRWHASHGDCHWLLHPRRPTQPDVNVAAELRFAAATLHAQLSCVDICTQQRSRLLVTMFLTISLTNTL